MPPAIRLDRLVRSYGAVRALDEVTAEFPGGAMGLLGPNGAGKTTLLKVLLGLLRADGGTSRVLGLDPATSPLELRGRTGYMPETDCFIRKLKGIRFVAYVGEVSGLPRRAALTRAHEVLHYVGLGEVRYRPVEEYSQGMRQRLRLAQALVHDPEILFLDEPTSGLDPGGRREMLALIKDLAEHHQKHVVLSSHLLVDVEEVCNHVVVLKGGRVASSGPLQDLQTRDDGLYEARVTGDRERLVELLGSRGFPTVVLKGDRVSVRLPETTRPLFAAAHETGAQIRELIEVTLTLEESLLSVFDPSGEES